MGQTNDKPQAKRQGSGAVKQGARFDSARFVQYELDRAEQAQCKAWDVDAGSVWQEVLALVDDGYSITVKFDTFNDAYACFVQVRGDPSHVNANLILTGRGSEPWKAVKQACFKSRAIGPSWVQYAERHREVIDD